MTKHCLWNCIGGIQSHERPTKFDFRWLSLEISTRKNNNNFISGHLNFRWRLLKRSASGKHCHTKKNENIKNHHLATSSLDPATASSSPDTTLPPNWFWGGGCPVVTAPVAGRTAARLSPAGRATVWHGRSSGDFSMAVFRGGYGSGDSIRRQIRRLVLTPSPPLLPPPLPPPPPPLLPLSDPIHGE